MDLARQRHQLHGLDLILCIIKFFENIDHIICDRRIDDKFSRLHIVIKIIMNKLDISKI